MSSSEVQRLPRLWHGWLTGPYTLSVILRVMAVTGLAYFLFGSKGWPNLLVAFVGFVGILIDSRWAVELTRDELRIRGPRPKSFARKSISLAYLPLADKEPGKWGRAVTLRLKSGREVRLSATVLTVDCDLWVETINEWLATGQEATTH